MKEFLAYIHGELSRMTSLHKVSEKLTQEDQDLLKSIRGTVELLESYAERTQNTKLYGITDDFEYSINHMWVFFKAESALQELKTRISEYKVD